MYQLDGQLIVSPTDLVHALACRHLTRLDLEVVRGLRAMPTDVDQSLEVLFARGLEHERAYLQRLRHDGLSVAEIKLDGSDRETLVAAEATTEQAMADGFDVIYQATFFDGGWRGHADFLLRRPDRPGRWSWSYDIADTKLARRLKVPAILQMAVYAERLTELQGIAPEQLIVVTGDGEPRHFRYEDCADYARLVRQEFLDTVESGAATRPEPVRQCEGCRWRVECRAQWRREDHLSLVAYLRRDHAQALREAGITTVRQLGSCSAQDLPSTIGERSRERLAQQARLQLLERDSGLPSYEILNPIPGSGLALLPNPSPGDVFFDIEGDPFVGEHGLEYLFGVLDQDGFTAYWATEPAREKQAFEALVDHLMRAWDRDPEMHVYHYASYEPNRLKALSGRYATRSAEVDRLLRGQRLVDLYTVVRQGLRISKESYSIKKLESFYWGHLRQGEGVSDAMGSVVAFERWLLEGDDALLEDIRAYNQIDCQSTQALRDWLEERRQEGGGDDIYERPVHSHGHPTEAAEERLGEIETLDRRLRATGESGDSDGGAARASGLLADLLDWHRRESLPEWWDYFHRLELTDEELVGDPAAVGQLRDATLVGTTARSELWRMSFPPQDTKLGVGESSYVNPLTGRSEGTVVDIAADEGWLVLKRSVRRERPTCGSLVPGMPLLDRDQRARLRDLAKWMLACGIHSPEPDWAAGRNLLLRRPSRAVGAGESMRRPGETAAEAVSRLALDLGGGVLPVQGPPGTGKTYTGARMILRLLAAGKRVGICAFSHRAISNLLDEVCRAATEEGTTLRAMQKADDYQRCASSGVEVTPDARDVAAALTSRTVDLVAGTAWLYAREDMQRTLDVLVVDEAGQLSLANVLSISGAATGMVLLGDPQQLSQPVKGVHPDGAEVSALDHLLAGRSTIDPTRGVLLDTTWRMHPDVADFVSWASYDGLLRVASGCERQVIGGSSMLVGAGLRYVPVEHSANSAASPGEADVIAGLIADLLVDGTWADARGQARPLAPADILVLTPYNAQVNRIKSRLRGQASEQVRVGTVDKFQGQEAPVVIYSMATSSTADAPRGIDFLYNLNRFNVAVSRARSLCVLVCSPRLLTPVLGKPEQIRPVNALCRFVTEATRISDAPAHLGRR